jgi:hypothetical protein
MMEICSRVVDGTFQVTVEQDDGGSHVQVAIERQSVFNIVDVPDKIGGYRVIVIHVPVGYLK